MLNPDPPRPLDDALARVEQRVRQLAAETAGWGAANSSRLDAPLDSLTLMAIVTRIEAAFGIELDSDEIVSLLGARDVDGLAKLVARKVAAVRANLDELAG